MDEQEKPFIEGRWGQFVNYECRHCPFKTISGEQEAWRHFAENHFLAPTPFPTPPVPPQSAVPAPPLVPHEGA